MKRLAVLLALLLPAPAFAVTVDDVLAEAKADCASFDNGVLTVAPQAVQPVELTGDATPETVVDWSGFACSTMASPWGGTGGNLLTVLIAGQRNDFMALGWTVVTLNGPVLVLALHGAECNATGSQPCAEALVWGGESLLSVRSGGGEEDDQPVEEGAEPEAAADSN